MGDWIALLSVDETWEKDRIANEKDRGVVADYIPVSLFGVEFDGETARITSSIGRAALTTHS